MDRVDALQHGCIHRRGIQDSARCIGHLASERRRCRQSGIQLIPTPSVPLAEPCAVVAITLPRIAWEAFFHDVRAVNYSHSTQFPLEQHIG